MYEESPKVVNVETSLEFAEFFPKPSFPPSPSSVRGGAPSRDGPPPAIASPSVTPSAGGAESKSAVDPRAEGTPLGQTPRVLADPADHADADPTDEVPAHSTTTLARRRSPSFRFDRARQPPLHCPHSPGPVTLVDLIERRGGLDWREAVAVIRQICLYLKENSPHSPILLDPRTIQISDKGEVQLLSGQTSSEPLVIQVGRLLRSMLMGKEAPPELRLLLSQATFELPIFESIEDVDRALAQINKLDEPGPAGLACCEPWRLRRRRPIPKTTVNPPPPIRSILPSLRAMADAGCGPELAVGIASGRLRLARRCHLRGDCRDRRAPADVAGYSSSPMTRRQRRPPARRRSEWRPLHPRLPSHRYCRAERKRQFQAESGRFPARRRTCARGPKNPGNGIRRRRGDWHLRATARPSPDVRRARLRWRGRCDAARRTGHREQSSSACRESASGDSDRRRHGSAARLANAAATPPSPRDSERRATSLLAQGQTALASMAFDSLVMSNPLYEPKTSDLSPEALATFRASQRQLLPTIAQRTFDRPKPRSTQATPIARWVSPEKR